jgi:Glycosyl hydrolase family 26
MIRGPKFVVTVLATMLTAGCTVVAAAGQVPPTAMPSGNGNVPKDTISSTATLGATSAGYLGVISAGFPASFTPAESFDAASGAKANIVGYYSGWLWAFQPTFALSAWRHGATTMIDINPPTGQAAMAAIADGSDDLYLRQFAVSVAAFGHPVIIDFAHEMDGNWTGYGYGSVLPATFIAAYRHVHDVFGEFGARNVTWVWAINVPVKGETAPLQEYFPGNAYVDWLGIDGYDWSTFQNFSEEFGPTLQTLATFSSKPVIISETSILQSPRSGEQVTEWLQGVVANHLLGLVWFDNNKENSGARKDKHDWLLEGDTLAEQAFQANAQLLRLKAAN